MKQYFLWAMAVMIPAGLIGWFLWMLGKALYSLLHDWRLHRELDELQAHTASRKGEPPPAAAPEGGSESPDYTTRM